jgi:hypothetical protein
MSSTNLKSDPHEHRILQSELPVATRLLLVPAVRLGRALDRLPVGDLGLLQVHLDLVALAEPPDHDLDVQLSHAREQHLVGLGVARDAETGSSSMRRCRAAEIFSSPRVGLDGEVVAARER